MTILVCGPTSYFPDDVHGKCDVCGKAIVYRPHAPKDVKRLCLDCLLKEVGASPEDRIILGATAKTIAEVAMWQRRN